MANVQLSYGLVILARGEEMQGGIDAIDRVFSTKQYIDRDHAELAARRGSKAALVDMGGGWLFPIGAQEWAVEHPGKPIMAFWIDDPEHDGPVAE